jgi:hypothetical protein
MPDSKIDISQDLIPDDAKLKTISGLASQMISKATEIVKATEILKKLEGEYKLLEEKTLPDAMLSAGVEEFKVANTGIKVVLSEGMSISVPKKNMPMVTAWLRANKHDDIIANEVTVPLPKGTNDRVIKKLEAGIKILKLTYTREESVHSGTLKALLKEQRAKGVDIDLKLFGAWEYKKAEIILPK